MFASLKSNPAYKTFYLLILDVKYFLIMVITCWVKWFTLPFGPSGESQSDPGPGEDALSRIRRLMAEGGMTAVVQRERSTTMASMGGFGNNIVVSHRIHRGSQTPAGAAQASNLAPSGETGFDTRPSTLPADTSDNPAHSESHGETPISGILSRSAHPSSGPSAVVLQAPAVEEDMVEDSQNEEHDPSSRNGYLVNISNNNNSNNNENSSRNYPDDLYSR